MPYLLSTNDLACPVYFCQSTEKGFKLSISRENATKLEDLQDAREEALRLEESFGMHVDVIPDC